MKILYTFVAAVVVIVLGFILLNEYIYNEKQGEGLPSDYKNITFILDRQLVTLEDGVYEMEAAPGSASKQVVRYFGNEVMHDIDGDGDEDVVFLVTQETGGSGTFFYVVGALKTDTGYEGTQALLIGGRIAPQTTEGGVGRQVVVNYADRAPGEPMSTQPSVGKSLYLLLDKDTGQFGEVVQGFEGEATASALGKYFGQAMFKAGTEDGLIPIEGFDAGLLMGKFEGLVAMDFDGVEAFEGVYSLDDGKVVFERTKPQPISSAETTVSEAGYATLLQNVSARLELSVRTEAEIDALIAKLK